MQQAIHVPQSIQLPLFEAFLAEPVLPGLKASAQARQKTATPSGSANCPCAVRRDIAKACWRRYCAT